MADIINPVIVENNGELIHVTSEGERKGIPDPSRLLPDTAEVSSDSVGNPVIFKAASRIDNTYWLCLPFNEDTNDRSTYGINTEAYGTVNIVSNAPSSPGGSAFFNGSSCLYGTLPAQFGTADFTVRFWMMAPEISGSSYPSTIFSTRQGELTSGDAVALHGTENGKLFIYSNTFITSNTDVPSVLKAGTWHHIAVVRKSGVATLYVDGNVYASGSLTNSLTRQAFSLGALWDGSNCTATGTFYMASLDVLNYAAYDGAFTVQTYQPGILTGMGYAVATDNELKSMLSVAGIDAKIATHNTSTGAHPAHYLTGVDYNTITETGEYYVSPGSGAANAPDGSSYMLYVATYAESSWARIFQTATRYVTQLSQTRTFSRIGSRASAGGEVTWTDWEIVSKNIGIPNYGARVDLSAEFQKTNTPSYTFTSNGWVVFNLQASGGSATPMINNSHVLNNILYPVAAGDVLSMQYETTASITVYFYPNR